MTVFIFAFLPLPVFDIVGIAAGVMRMNWGKYLLAAVLGKTLKFFLAVVGIYYVLPSILPFLADSSRIIIENAFEQFGVVY